MSSYSYITYSGDGSTDTFVYGSLALLSSSIVPAASQLVVSVDGVDTPFTLVDSTTLQLGSAPAAGATVIVARDTKIDDRYVDWTSQSQIDQATMNLDSDQTFFLAQEAKEAAENAVQLTGGMLDAGGQRVINVAPPVDANDAVNLAQLNASLAGGAVSQFAGQGYQSRTSTGVSEEFTLVGLAGRSATDINVFVDGVRLTGGYTAVDFGQDLKVTVNSQAVGAVIALVWSEGLVVGQVNPALVDWASTPNDVIPYAAIDVAPSDEGEFLTVVGGIASFEVLTTSDVQDFDSVLAATGLETFAAPSSALDLGSQRLTNVAPAVSNTDAPTWGQVQVAINAGGGGGGGGGGATTLGGLSDVDLAGVSNGDVITYNGGIWTPSAGGGGTPGADGKGWTGGSYDVNSGIVTFTSNDGLGFATGDLRGADGSPGTPGSPGSPGQNGQDGAAATIAVGAVNTGAPGTNVLVTNSGDTTNAIFNFTIPQGQPGSGGSGGGVTSVNGDSGPTVVLDLDDMDDVPTKPSTVVGGGDQYLVVDSSNGTLSWEDVPSGGGGSGVTSVNGDAGPTVVLGVDDINDVALGSTVNTNDVLAHVGGGIWSNITIPFSTYVNASEAADAAPIQSLSGTGDISVTEPTTGNFQIAYTGSGGGGGGAIGAYGLIIMDSSVNLNTNTMVQATFDTSSSEEITNNMTATTSGLRVDSAGVYEIAAQYNFTASSSRSVIQMQLTKNGTALGPKAFAGSSNTGNGETGIITYMLDLAVNDVIGFEGKSETNANTSGNTQDTTGNIVMKKLN